MQDAEAGEAHPDAPGEAPVQVVIVDDYPVAREALPALLAENGIVVSATAASASDAREMFDLHHPAVALIGVSSGEQAQEMSRRLLEAEGPPVLIRTHDRE